MATRRSQLLAEAYLEDSYATAARVAESSRPAMEAVVRDAQSAVRRFHDEGVLGRAAAGEWDRKFARLAQTRAGESRDRIRARFLASSEGRDDAFRSLEARSLASRLELTWIHSRDIGTLRELRDTALPRHVKDDTGTEYVVHRWELGDAEMRVILKPEAPPAAVKIFVSWKDARRTLRRAD